MPDGPRFLIHDARILTLAGGPGPRRLTDPVIAAASDASDRHARWLGLIPRGWVVVRGDRIEAVGEGDAPASLRDVPAIGAAGRVLLPGFIDCHTHACWAGQRFDEADLRLAGVPYLDILAKGGGIMSTVRATRAATVDALRDGLLRRVAAALAFGTTTIEVKSGYGLTVPDERKMLEAIRLAARATPARLVPTLLGAHAKDPANPAWVNEAIDVLLPAAAEAFPGIACDAYCEKGAWSLEECLRLFRAASRLGCPIRVHADQFNPLGMTGAAIELGARSVDHLEATTAEERRRLAASPTIGVALPGCGFHLDNRYTDARSFLDEGGALAIASNCNPGSSPTIAMPFIIALAVRFLRLTPAEAIAAATVNAAHVLGLGAEVGSIEPGKRADLQLLATADERTLAYEYGNPGPDAVWIAGQAIR